jgi:phosphopantothenoylcysteine decarboxylase/phosphopantothenate--cysteine ligase
MSSRRSRRRSKGDGGLEGRKILLAVTGGISAYKSAFLVRLLVKSGAVVRVLMTGAATRFVTPLTFEVLSGNPVPMDMFASRSDAPVAHVDLAAWADAVVIAPATADFIAKVAGGIADDLPSTVVCAARCPVWLAPAMNDGMWDNPAVRRNIRILAEDGRRIIDPGEGDLACGTRGAGRMAEPGDIVSDLTLSFGPGPLSGVRMLITAGRTEEEIDPVRYISNRSSGKMGFALARRAAELGAEVTLVHGPVDVPPPAVSAVRRIGSAAEMKNAVSKAFPKCDVLIMAAAVADYTPASKSRGKIKKGTGGMSLDLEPTADILAGLAGRKKDGQTVVGFALESGDGEASARRKGAAKGCDYIVLNMIGDETGFGTDTNRITVFKGNRKVAGTGLVTKDEAASAILEILSKDRNVKKVAG